MRILFTGGSSFTGLWFIQELARAGHEVVATFRQRPEQYRDELRRRRVALALKACRGVFGCSFGDRRFLELLHGETWDLLCHHAADVTDYKSPDFDLLSAVGSNTHNLAAVMDALKSPRRVVLTGSVFENDEGAGSDDLPAFSPYGLSKSFTYQIFRHHALRLGCTLGKFVIPNPFGPHEDPRFTAYLLKTWLSGQAATVNTPEYVRDNIHVSLLARAYARFAAELPTAPVLCRMNPSGYPESQGAFSLRVAVAMRERLGLPCEVKLQPQISFTEPRVRINTDLPDAASLGWNESCAWDELAAFYRGQLG
jgi:UDP-glucose 4-epimerase